MLVFSCYPRVAQHQEHSAALSKKSLNEKQKLSRRWLKTVSLFGEDIENKTFCLAESINAENNYMEEEKLMRISS